MVNDKKILAVETSTNACSVALLVNGEIIEHYELAPQQHAQLILAMANDLLAEAAIKLSQVDAIAFACGPGSFTGVRIAASVAQGLALGADLPVIAISTLRVLAQGVFEKYGATKALAGLDARMDEVYFGIYKLNDGLMQQQVEDGLYKPEDVPLPSESGWFGAGDAWKGYAGILERRLKSHVQQRDSCFFPRAQSLVKLAQAEFLLGNTITADKALPVYLRNKIVRI